MKLHNTKKMLLDAQAGHYAVPAFNIHNLETLSTVVETAAEMCSPVIIAATPSTVAYAGKDYLIALVGTAMEKYDIPMSFHLDHHEDVADIEDTVAAGCRSVMIDASKLPYEENVKKVQQVVAFSHTCHATVEAELGRLVGQEDNVVVTDADKVYTNPDDAVRYVEETGLFDGKGTLAAHCVHLDDEDIAIIKKHAFRVAHNPGSNMKLASGIAPVPRLLKEGVCVALGTDGASSNNNLDMLEEINLAAMLHKVSTLDPLAVPARTALKMGTEYGAKAVGLTGVGKLEVGCKADITLFDMAGAAWYPRNDLASQLVYSAHADSASTVLVDGRVLMEDGELLTLDKERIFYEAQKCAERLTK